MSGPRKVYGDGGLGSISAVVSSLPAGYKLGEERMEPNGDQYALVYNACNQQISKGFACARNVGSAAVAGPYSVTVTTVTETAYQAAGMIVHATATTGTYAWALTKNVGSSVAVHALTSIATTTGVYLQLAADGKFTNGTTQAVGYAVAALTGGAVGGGAWVDFKRLYTQ